MLYKYEAGISVPRASTLKRICDELRISTDAMLGEETQQPDPKQEIDKVVHDVSALFAGGVLPEEDKDALMHAILDAYAKSKEMNSRK